jgi:hypothetical protein
MTKRIILSLFTLFIYGVCYADPIEESKNRAYLVTATDAITTAIALSKGGVDLNPLIGSNQIMIVPITLLKVGIINHIASEDIPDKDKKNKLDFVTSVWGGASINNFLILLGVSGPAPLLIGAMSGYMMYGNFSETTNE